MNYNYTFIKDKEYITVRGSGDDLHDLKGIEWVSSPNASGVLKQMMKQESGYSPAIGFVAFKDFTNDFYVQIARFGSIYKDGWRFKDTNLSAIPVESTELGKAKKRVYVKASTTMRGKRKAHYRMQEVGREEVAPVENLWEITADQFGRLVSGSKTELQAKYIKEHNYGRNESHPELERLITMMDDHMKDMRVPFLEDFVDYAYKPVHNMSVWRALDAGETVPFDAIKDYPDVMDQYNRREEQEKEHPNESWAVNEWNVTKDPVKVTKLWEMSKDEYDKIIDEVIKDYSTNPLDITDAMLKTAYPEELEDTKRSARMRKKIFNNLPEEFKNGFCPETMNHHLHADIVQYAAVSKVAGIDVPRKVKNEYPMLFKDVPVNYSPTGDKVLDEKINGILGDLRDEMEGSVSQFKLWGKVMDMINSDGRQAPIYVAIEDHDAEELCEKGINDISLMLSPDLLDKIEKSDKLIRIKWRQDMARSNFNDGTLNLSKSVINTDYMSYSSNTICHEYGHAIEHMIPEIKSLCGEFLNRRTADEPVVNLIDMFPNSRYKEGELTSPDRFIDAYIGKYYTDHATEVLSMGMGYLSGEGGTMQMFMEDPEYLGFIVAVMSGEVGSKKISKGLMFEINLSELNT